jgi:hypothetical protein
LQALALLQTVVGSCMAAGPNVVGSGCQARPKRFPTSIIICVINILGMKNSMICVMNIIIFTIIKSIHIKNIIFCVINILLLLE